MSMVLGVLREIGYEVATEAVGRPDVLVRQGPAAAYAQILWTTLWKTREKGAARQQNYGRPNYFGYLLITS